MREWLNDWFVILAATLGAGTVITIAWRTWILPGLLGIFHAQQEATQTLRAISKIVGAELTTDSGASLVDKVDKIEPNHLAAMAAIEQLNAEIKGVHIRLDAVEYQQATAAKILADRQMETAIRDIVRGES